MAGDNNGQFSRVTERSKKFAPELLSKTGKVSVTLIFIIMSLFAINGWIKLEIDFQLDFFITDPDH